MQRYFIDQSKTAGKVILPEEVAHHLVTVLRAAVGTKFELVMADHQAYLAELISITPGNVIAKLIENLGKDSELPVKTILACGLVPIRSSFLRLNVRLVTGIAKSNHGKLPACRKLLTLRLSNHTEMLSHRLNIALH